MINPEEFTVRCSIQDYSYYSSFYGEPFESNGVLWFSDGCEVRIVGYDEKLNTITPKLVTEILDTAMSLFSIRCLTIEAPHSPWMSKNIGVFKFSYKIPPTKYDCELFIDLKSFIENSKHRSDINRAKNKNLSCRIIAGGTLQVSIQQWKLVESHICSFEPCSFYKAEYIMAFYYLMSDPDSVLFEVYRIDKLAGFALVRNVDKLAIIHMVVSSTNKSGVSDLLYSEIIKYYKNDENCSLIALGTCPTKGLYEYKRKWSNGQDLQPTTEYVWHHKEKRAPGENLWITRLLNRIERATYRY